MRAAGEPMPLFPAAAARRRLRRRHVAAATAHPSPAPVCCSAEEVRAKFERYGPIRDVYLPKDFCEPS